MGGVSDRAALPPARPLTASAILKGTGSVGLSMIYWTLGFFTSLASLTVFLEYAAYFPNRSGSGVVYLEQAYPRPRWLIPTAFAFQSVALSFSSGNSIGECRPRD